MAGIQLSTPKIDRSIPYTFLNGCHLGVEEFKLPQMFEFTGDK
jgi:hypothetical protein